MERAGTNALASGDQREWWPRPLSLDEEDAKRFHTADDIICSPWFHQFGFQEAMVADVVPRRHPTAQPRAEGQVAPSGRPFGSFATRLGFSDKAI
jgi:hypothetical protein